ncbi:hypothetical protein K457DRAFT_659817 [Linnemannia elongata AG-77]|uniref:Uncharacterized protein n=1 Tax=Linnemannia elongata AG-77 TaxID=1314771 RepID=A0A197JRJ9_9FUNG|nr:hypothetical protein K457DRAFT_659817 [Linnemannia elongata AG-77]
MFCHHCHHKKTGGLRALQNQKKKSYMGDGVKGCNRGQWVCYCCCFLPPRKSDDVFVYVVYACFLSFAAIFCLLLAFLFGDKKNARLFWSQMTHMHKRRVT